MLVSTNDAAVRIFEVISDKFKVQGISTLCITYYTITITKNKHYYK